MLGDSYNGNIPHFEIYSDEQKVTMNTSERFSHAALSVMLGSSPPLCTD